MKSTKEITSKEVNVDDLISKLVTLESKELTKRRKRKSVHHTENLTSETTPRKRPKIEINSNDGSLMLSPIKIKSEVISNPESEDDIRLPELVKSKKKKEKMILPKADTIQDKKAINKGVSHSKRDLKAKSNSASEELIIKPVQIKTEKDQLHSVGKSSFDGEKPLQSSIKPKKEKGFILMGSNSFIKQESKSSSEDDVKLPTPIKTKNEKDKEQPHRLDNTKNKGKKVSSDRKNTNVSSNSDIDVPVPKPKLTKMKKSRSVGESNFNKEEMLHLPIKYEKEDSKSSITAQDSESSSEEEVTLPTPIKTKKEKDKEHPHRLDNTKNKGKKVSNNINTDIDVSVPKPKLTKTKKSRSIGESSFNEEEMLHLPIKPEEEGSKSSITAQDSESSSEEEVKLPTPIKTKKEKDKEHPHRSDDTKNKGKKVSNTNSNTDIDVSSPTPKLTKTKKNRSIGESRFNKEEMLHLPIKFEKEGSKSSSIAQGSESSSEEEVKLPKPIKTKKERDKEHPHRLDDTKNKGKRVSNANSNTDIDVPVPKPKLTKTKKSRSIGESSFNKEEMLHLPIKYGKEGSITQSSSDDDVKLPEPIKTKKEKDKGSPHKTNDTKNKGKKEPTNKTTVAKKNFCDKEDLNASSNSENDVPVPSPKQTKMKNTDLHAVSKSNFNEEKIKYEKKDSSIMQDSESSSEEDVKLPTPIKMEKDKGHPRKSDDTTNKGKKNSYSRRDSNANSNSENDVPVPKPKQTKTENIDLHSVRESSFNKKKILPSPIKYEAKDANSSSEDEDLSPKRKQTSSIAKKKLSGLFDSSGIEANVRSIQKESNKQISKKSPELLQDIKLTFDEQRHTDSQLKNSNSDLENVKDERLSAQQPKWVQELQLEYPRLKAQTIDFNLPLRHTKCSLLRIPKDVNANILKNLKCKFKKEVYVTLNDEQYLFEPLISKPKPIFVSSNNPTFVNLDKVIMVHKSAPLSPVKNLNILERDNVSLPDAAIKTRHPLFGVDYKKRIRMKKNIKEKIINAIESKIKLEKKEIRRKHRSKQKGDLVDDEKNIIDLLNFGNVSKHSGQELFLSSKDSNPAIFNGAVSSIKHKKKNKNKSL